MIGERQTTLHKCRTRNTKQPLQAALIEDDAVDMKRLEKLVISFFKENRIQYALQTWESIPQQIEEMGKLDLLFLDMEVNGRSGIEFAKKLRAVGFSVPIIITSAYNEYLMDGYTVHAFQYLLKPFTAAKFQSVMEQFMNEQVQELWLIRDPRVSQRDVFCDEILWIESQMHKTTLFLQDGTRLSTTYPMRHWLDLLKKLPFSRSSQSYLVRLSAVAAIESHEAILQNGNRIPISRTFSKTFCEELSIYMRTRL